MRTPIPGRGALRSQEMHTHQPTYNKKQRGAPGWCSLLFRNGKRDPYSRRGASDFPRIVANTPGPWKGSFEVAGDGSASQNTKQQGEPLRSSLLLWSGKRDSDPRPQPWQGCALPTELFPHDVSLNASAKVTKICESPNFSVPFCNFFTITEPQDKSNRPPPASHTAYYQSDILHSEIKRTKSSGQSSRLSVPAIDIRKGVELHPDTASALRNPHQYPKRPTIFRAGSSTKKRGSSILIVRTQYRA